MKAKYISKCYMTTMTEIKIGLLAIMLLFSCANTKNESDIKEIDSTINDKDQVVIAHNKIADSSIATKTKGKPIKHQHVTAATTMENIENPQKVKNNRQEFVIPKPSDNEVTTELNKDSVTQMQPNIVQFHKEGFHESWDQLLKKYVSAAGLVNYAGLLKEVDKLKSYLDLLKTNNPQPDWQRNERLAFWINTYNAATVKLILDHYPVKSITTLHDGKPWDYKFIQIGDRTYSLNQIEHDIIRPVFKEPRIHFALNCAAKSCPKLLNEAFEPNQLEQQLERQTLHFVSNTEKNDINENLLKLSGIFDWYKEDFGNIPLFLARYSQTTIAANATIDYLTYDWNLNE